MRTKTTKRKPVLAHKKIAGKSSRGGCTDQLIVISQDNQTDMVPKPFVNKMRRVKRLPVVSAPDEKQEENTNAAKDLIKVKASRRHSVSFWRIRLSNSRHCWLCFHLHTKCWWRCSNGLLSNPGFYENSLWFISFCQNLSARFEGDKGGVMYMFVFFSLPCGNLKQEVIQG